MTSIPSTSSKPNSSRSANDQGAEVRLILPRATECVRSALFVALALVFVYRVAAAPGFASPASSSRLLSPRVIASQLHINKTTSLGSLHYSGWYMIHAETPANDPPFLFFNGDPMHHRYVVLWSGGEWSGEVSSIERWVLKNARGIASKLASCFATKLRPNDADADWP